MFSRIFPISDIIIEVHFCLNSFSVLLLLYSFSICSVVVFAWLRNFCMFSLYIVLVCLLFEWLYATVFSQFSIASVSVIFIPVLLMMLYVISV